MSDADTIFFRLPLRDNCKAAASHIESLKGDRPEFGVRELNILTNIGLASRYGIKTVPGLVVRGKTLTGVVSNEAIADALGLSEA